MVQLQLDRRDRNTPESLLLPQAERQSLRLQLEHTASELRLSLEQNGQLTGRLHKAEREVSSLSCQVTSSEKRSVLDQRSTPIVMLHLH